MLNTKENHPPLRDQLKLLKDQIQVRVTKTPHRFSKPNTQRINVKSKE